MFSKRSRVNGIRSWTRQSRSVRQRPKRSISAPYVTVGAVVAIKAAVREALIRLELSWRYLCAVCYVKSIRGDA